MDNIMTRAAESMQHVAHIAAKNTQTLAKIPAVRLAAAIAMVALAVISVAGLLALAGVGIYLGVNKYLKNRDIKIIDQDISKMNYDELVALQADGKTAKSAGELDRQGKLALEKLTKEVVVRDGIKKYVSEMGDEALVDMQKQETFAGLAGKLDKEGKRFLEALTEQVVLRKDIKSAEKG